MLKAEICVVLRLPYDVAIEKSLKEGWSYDFVLGVNAFCFVSLELQDLLKYLHDREVDFVVVEQMTKFRVHKELVNPVLKLFPYSFKRRVFLVLYRC